MQHIGLGFVCCCANFSLACKFATPSIVKFGAYAYAVNCMNFVRFLQFHTAYFPLFFRNVGLSIRYHRPGAAEFTKCRTIYHKIILSLS